jgi:hypothetical protein
MSVALRSFPLIRKEIFCGNLVKHWGGTIWVRCVGGSSNLTSTSAAGIVASKWANQRVTSWMQRYEDFLGLTEVKDAQTNVMDVRTVKQWVSLRGQSLLV